MLLDAVGLLLDAVGWSWMLLVGPGWSLVLLLASQFHGRWHLFVLEPCRAEEAGLALHGSSVRFEFPNLWKFHGVN